MAIDEIIEDALRRAGFLDLMSFCCGTQADNPLPPRKGDHQMTTDQIEPGDLATMRNLRAIILADRDRISQRCISDETLACLSQWLSDYRAADAVKGKP